MTELAAPLCDDGAIWAAWMAAFHAPTLAVADELGLFQALEGNAASATGLASTLGIEVRATEAIAGLMSSLGFLSLVDSRFQLTDVARTYLLPSSPYYWGGMLRRIRDNPLDCRKLIDSLRRGNALAEARLNSMWQAPAPPPEALVAFTHAMHAHSFSLAMRTIRSFDLGTHLLDVAGGSGSYSIAAALAHPALTCTLLDLPAVCDVAEAYAAELGVGARFSTTKADMFAAPWPTGHDRVLLADVLHDWDDENCRALAARSFDALPSGGRILVHEMLLDETKAGPPAAIAYSVIMVFVTRGRQRSATEIQHLLASAGFSAIRVIPTANGYSIVEGTRPAS
jgi:hypothetical protein